MHPARGAGDHHHLVQFYDEDDFLAATVVEFAGRYLSDGGAVVIAATPAHLTAFEAGLAQRGIHLDAALEDDHYVPLDAQATLQLFMREGVPDPDAFARHIGGLIDRAARGDREVRVFGEMVALLWTEGNLTGALRLEELWNDLARTHDFELLCGYRMDSFADPAEAALFDDVCGRHSRVLPAESYSASADPDERLRDVARLQQRAAAQTGLATTLGQLSELSRMRDEFVAMVVHDIRAPMSVIGGFLELLRDNMSQLDEARIHDLLDRGLDNVRHVTQLVNDILTVSEIESGHFSFELKEVDMVELVYRAVSEVRDVSPGTRFAVSTQGSLPAAWADEVRQLQILTNLLTNAAKFSPVDSTVYASVRRSEDALVVGVRDEGMGIADGDRPKLFQRFSRLEDPGGKRIAGTGLGLFITKALVEGQGGTITLDSAPGRGSTFTYTVPLAR